MNVKQLRPLFPIFSLIMFLFLAGCGGGSSSSSGGNTATVVGYFVDAPVTGITYSYTVNGVTTSGITGAGGAFNYPTGTPVTFSIGKITFGTITPQGTVTPIQLAGAGSSATSPAVQSMVQLLLSLDPSAQAAVAGSTDPSTITISPAVLAAANNLTPITIDATTSQTALQTLLTTIGNATSTTFTLVTPTQANTHMSGTINGIFAGYYTGTYSGTSVGTWSVVIDAAGNVTGTTGNGYAITGAMSTTFNTNGFSFTGSAAGLTWIGTLDINGGFTGNWGTGNTAGSYTGMKSVAPLGAAITATAKTTAQNLTVGTAMPSFSPLTASGGVKPYTYSYSGTLPAGLSFNASTGVVTGTPNTIYSAANLVFSVKDTNNSIAGTTSTVSFAVVAAPAGGGSGNGVTFSQTVGGHITVADFYFNGVNNTGGFTSAVTGGEIIQWYNSDHAAAVLNYETARNFIAINFNGAAYVMCGISGPVDSFPDCASIKVTLDRAGGTIMFSSSPMLDLSFIANGITVSGTLSFTPF
jgi:hypothetical protein